MARLRYPTVRGRTGNPLQRPRVSAYPSVARRTGNPLQRPKAPRAPRATRGGYTSPRKPLLGPDSVQVMPDRPSAGDIDYGRQQFSGGTGGYDVGSDPAVARIGALSERIRAEARASAAAKRKQAALEYGDPTGVEGVDEETAKAARANPFSMLAAMKRAYDTGLEGLEEGLNKANLFYSGYRGQQLGEAGTAYQQNRYDAGNRFRATITDINDALAAALLNADIMDANAAMDSGGGYYDPGGDYGPWDEGPPEPEEASAAATGTRRSARRKTVRVAGKAVPVAAARRQLNRAISEAKVRARPAPKARPRPARRGGKPTRRSGR